ncbi:Acetyltransferase (GNAT) family protein [Arachidicoccus rhizosphaerae]|uniref:Acetyltransferase (GNAT) family protein n=1 Tax=Arachidicoccus rhizosphaerae TaxID=551991 RepID=A0A1H3ZHZ0_9BACT|nr:GNAT family N-acetyltransferase [Arachidicoccus rhizosphaerae]SEA22914.1 Acetyltransferase (GNAT) family protein [Arachidicoccus rhizosphaerae]
MPSQISGLSKQTLPVYQIKTGYANMQVTAIHQYLSQQSYWAGGIPLETVDTALKNSFCIGAFTENKQVGFARLITDYSTFAYLADVYILENHRKQGLSKAMMTHLMELPWVGSLRRLMLATKDAHELYRQFGFGSPLKPELLMEITRPGIYLKKKQ